MATATGIDLAHFCRETTSEYSRHNLTKPWKDGKWVYASDGHILIRVPSEDCEEMAFSEKHPKRCDEFFKGINRASMIPFPRKKANVRTDTCLICDGSGTHGKMVKCRECGHEHQAKCKNCDSEGYGEFPHNLMVCGRRISVKYLAMIRSLPRPVRCSAAKEEERLWFVFSGGQGTVQVVKLGSN